MKIRSVKLFFILLFLSPPCLLKAQDSVLARRLLDTLTSPVFWGRGYTNNGVHKAADFLTGQIKGYGLSPMDGKSYLQEFGYPVNTFPGKMEVSINGKALIPGRDFIVSPDSRGIKASCIFFQTDSVHFVDTAHHVMILFEKKLTWSVEPKAADYTIIELDKNLLHETPKTAKLNIENVEIPYFKTANICAVVKGTDRPDSLIVFTAHYDHLGGMGNKTYFPGANDNASGVIQVLSLAKYYAMHRQRYTMAFILFSGEEAGLLGSTYFTENPLMPLQNIRFLVNLDLEGTGIDGITVVNATVYPKEFDLLKQLNQQGKYLPKVNPRGKAPNSDHYLFTQKSVPAFYIYTLGGIQAYHDIYDISKTLPLTKYNDLFQLLVRFNSALTGKSNTTD